MAEHSILIAQIIGFIAFFISVLSFQFKHGKTILWVQVAATIFWATHFYLIGAYIGALMSSLAIIRNSSGALLPTKHLPATALVFSSIAFGLSLMVAESLLYFSACLGSIFNTCSIIMKDKPFYFRTIQFFGEIFWLIYSVTVMSWGGIVLGLFLTASNITGALRHEQETIRKLFVKTF